MDEVSALLDEVLGDAPGLGVLAWPDSRLIETFETLHVLEQRVVAAKLVTLREIDGRGLPGRHGAQSAGLWLRNRHHMSLVAGQRMARLAKRLDSHLPSTAAALARGAVNAEQAEAIAKAVFSLPSRLRAEGERRLLKDAETADPAALAAAGSRLLEVLDPEAADRRASEREARAAARAHRERDFRLIDVPGTASVRIVGSLDREAAAIVRAALDPLCSPRRRLSEDAGSADRDAARDADRDADRAPLRTAGQRRADAFVELCQLASACGELPDNGGDRPQVVVTVGLQTLLERVGVATLEDGGTLSPEDARRMACDALVMPMVLGGPGQVLDAGRARRLFSGPLRRALVVRDGGCSFPDCDRPPRWCSGHHVVSWADGGRTDLGNAVLLCYAHHRLIHDGDWLVRINPVDGLPEFTPPAFVDMDQRPRRNLHHRQHSHHHHHHHRG